MELDAKQRKNFISMLKIYNRNTKRVSNFKMNKVQEELLDVLEKHNRVLVLKARRFGISTLIRAFQFVNVVTADEPHTYALLAHTNKAAKEVSKMDARFYDNMPSKIRPKLSVRNTTTLTVDKSGATVEVFTGGSKGGTRAFEAYMAHLSEFAFYDDQDETLTTVIPTVGDGQIVIESTPNAVGDKFHELVLGALKGENDWHLCFFPWFRHDEYQCSVPPTFRMTKDEAALKEELKLTMRQIAWRRKEIATLGMEKFIREYPATVEEAFKASTEYYINRDALDAIEILTNKNDEVFYNNVNFKDKYVLGVDVSAGVGLDYSAISIVSNITRQPVYQWRSNTTSPDKLAEKVIALSRKYNSPKVIVESNNDGGIVLSRLKQYKCPNLWKGKDKKYFRTTTKTRPELFNEIRSMVEEGMIDKLTPAMHKELSELIWKKDRPDHNDGGHDDLVVSIALCYYVLKDMPLVTMHRIRKNMADELIREARASRLRGNKMPMKPHGGW